MNLLFVAIRAIEEDPTIIIFDFLPIKDFQQVSECQAADVPFGWVEALWKVGKLDAIDMGN